MPDLGAKAVPNNITCDTAVFSQPNTINTTFTITHNLGGTPDVAIVVAGSSDAYGAFTWVVDSTSIIVNYEIPPAQGTNNVKLIWAAMQNKNHLLTIPSFTPTSDDEIRNKIIDANWNTLLNFQGGGGGGVSTNTAGNSATFSGNASTTVFNIAHGLGVTPTGVSVVPQSDDAEGNFKVACDATNITVTYSQPPASGTNNVKFWWVVVTGSAVSGFTTSSADFLTNKDLSSTTNTFGDIVTKQPFTYTIWTNGSGTYYAKNNTTGVVTTAIDAGVGTYTGFSKLMYDTMVSFGTAGGKILIKNGLYMINKSDVTNQGQYIGVKVPLSQYIEIEGEGWGTILKLSDPMLWGILDASIPLDSVAYSYVRLANMQIDGNKPNTTRQPSHSVVDFAKRTDVVYENLLVRNGVYQGISITGEARTAGQGGTRCRVINCVSRDNNDNNYDVGTTYFQMHNCVSINSANGSPSGTAGLDYDTASYCEVDGYISIGDRRGIYTGIANVRPTNRHLFNNMIIKDPVVTGIEISGVAGLTINNTYIENAGLYGINNHDGSTDVQINNTIINGSVSHGIVNQVGCLRTQISNTRVYNSGTSSSGISCDSSDGMKLSNVSVEHSNVCGVIINNSKYCHLTNVDVADSTTLDGIRIVGGSDGTKVNNCHVTTSRNGFFVNLSKDTQFNGCTAYLNGRHGFSAFGGTRSQFVNCYAWDNSTSSSGGFDGFNFDGDVSPNGPSVQCTMIACKAFDSHTTGSKTQRYGVNMTANSNNCLIVLSDIRSNNLAVGIINNGTSNLIKNNVGDYIAENSGQSIQSGNGSTTTFNIAHGLSGTPKAANVTAGSSAAAGTFYVTTTSTNIVVNYTVAPASGTNNLTFNWRADIYT